MSPQILACKKTTSSRREAWKTIIHTVVWGLVWIVLLVGIYQAWRVLHNPSILPIRAVSVMAGNLHMPQADIEHIVYENLEGTLLSLNEAKLKKALLQIPWVENVSIRRIWPDRIMITMTEQVAIARWGHEQLLNKDLEIFSPSPDTFPPNLPRLFGPKDSQKELWRQYEQLNERLASLHLQVMSLELSPRKSWSFLLSNDVEVIWGREDLDQRLKRFIQAYPRLAADRPAGIAIIDLRYPNGFAVKWKDENLLLSH